MKKILIALVAIFSATLVFSQEAKIAEFVTDGSPSSKDDTQSASSSSPRFSKDGKKIIFVTHADNFKGPHKIVMFTQVAELDLETGKITYLYDFDYYQSEPSYNQDASRAVFRTESQNFGNLNNKLNSKGMRTSQIGEWDRATGKVKYLTDGDNWSDFPEYSPDGNRVVFQTRSGGFSGKFSKRQNEWGDPEQQIAEYDRKTGKVTYLTDGDGESSRPHYSPDGRKVVFATGALNLTSEPPGRRYQIAELDLKTGKFKYLTNGDSGSGNPSYSPDGKRIVFETRANFDGSNSGDKTQIAEIEVATGRITYVTHGDGESSLPAYSADGSLIAFTTRSGGFEGPHTERKDEYGNIAQIAEWNRSTGKIRYLTDGDKPSIQASYSPAGAVVFCTQADNFSGTHKPRVEFDLNRNELPVFQIALIK